jgi:hypothetical protein
VSDASLHVCVVYIQDEIRKLGDVKTNMGLAGSRVQNTASSPKKVRRVM